ncbi:MAG: flagellar basal body P-ring formation protein FlgA, partial [Alphaproteobacteria bacterium]|nr:flagellar basal body P-ring formation protein FlgA [Alphaproteobacteria bacterium]
AAATAAAPGTAAVSDAVRIVVPDRNIARGDVIAASDLSYESVAPIRASGGVATQLDQLAGKQARLFLRAGEPVLVNNVRAPILVTKGSTVTVTFNAPGISLTAIGKAMSEGGMGETVTVLNPVSYRQISATVTGPGTVSAGSLTATVAADPAPAELAAIQ